MRSLIFVIVTAFFIFNTPLTGLSQRLIVDMPVIERSRPEKPERESRDRPDRSERSDQSQNRPQPTRSQPALAGIIGTSSDSSMILTASPGVFTNNVIAGGGRISGSIRQAVGNRTSVMIKKNISPAGHHYLTLNLIGTTTAPQPLMALIQQNPGRFFPFFNAAGRSGASIQMNNVFDLDITFLGFNVPYSRNTVRVTSVTPYTFTFTTEPDHVLRGSVNHGIVMDDAGEIWLFQEGAGVVNEENYRQELNYKAAGIMWEKMAHNIREGLQTSKPENRKYRF